FWINYSFAEQTISAKELNDSAITKLSIEKSVKFIKKYYINNYELDSNLNNFVINIRGFPFNYYSEHREPKEPVVFYTSNPPPKPVHIQPGSPNEPGPILKGSAQIFKWKPSPGAKYYEIYIRDIATNELYIFTETGTSTTIKIFEGGKSYRWNMQAFNDAGKSDNTERWYFQIAHTYTLLVNSYGACNVSINSSTGHGGIENYIKAVEPGTSVSLTAPIVVGDYVFQKWSGDVKSSSNVISFTMDGNKAVIAHYIPQTDIKSELKKTSQVIYINNLEELQKIGNDASYPLNGIYELNRDIDASDSFNWNNGAGFKPIGSKSNSFTGKFNGKGHKITNLYISRLEENYVALFGNIGSGGEVKDLGLENCWIIGKDYVGGLVGINGYSDLSKDCYKSGDIENSYTTGAVFGENNVGGLVGKNNIGSITNSYSAGIVSGDLTVGGLVGNNIGSIMNSYSSVIVFGYAEVGGFVGNNGEGIVINSYSTGKVSGIIDVGGLAGGNWGNILNSYSTGKVFALSSCVGSLVGSNEGNIVSSYFDLETSGQETSRSESGKTTKQMQSKATYVGWDFVNIWAIEEGLNYPYLRGLGPTQISTSTIVKTKEIRNLEELSKIGIDPKYPWWWNYELMADIDASDTINWDGGKGFKPLILSGKFNGNGHVIQNLYINRPNEDNIGLFGILGYRGEVRNIRLEGCSVVGKGSVGCLVGTNIFGNIMNSYSKGKVSGSESVGGLVGANTSYGTIEKSYSTAAVSGSEGVGGLVGANSYGSIMNS
ncbi:MAG TPA: GLUG motif-containing protein, partial [Candidatus Hydrogenedens sp.]|nr:GLUG motif-containing protein [Candidatus Hydrogenedens sp.]